MNLYDLAIARKLSGGGGGGGGGGSEIETGTWTPSASTVTREFISFAETHSKLPTIIILALIQNSADSWGNDRVALFQYTDFYQLYGKGFNTQKNASDGFGYSLIEALTWYSGGSDTTVYKMMTSHNSSETGDTDKTYPRYFVKENGFYATSNFKSSGALFQRPSSSGNEWHWIAIWT